MTTRAETTITSLFREDLICLKERLQAAQEHDYETAYRVLIGLLEALLDSEETRLQQWGFVKAGDDE